MDNEQGILLTDSIHGCCTDDYSVFRGRPSRFQSLMCSMMTFVADSGVSWRPMHSTKSLSGSRIKVLAVNHHLFE